MTPIPPLEAVRLIANFKTDLLAMARQHLAYPPSENIPDNEVLPKYFDSLRRWPAARPRRVWEADDFTCPPDAVAGWQLLREKIIKGENIRPHLAREHDALSYRDGLLNEWNIHHLHLGVGHYFKDPFYIARTKELIFALISDNDFYAINVYRQHGDWESTNIVESVHRNWPEIIRGYRITGIPGERLSSQERKTLRGANTQTFTTVSDGTVYAPVRGGVVCSGISVEAMMRAAKVSDDIKRLKIAMKEQIERFLVPLRLRGWSDGRDIRATLVGVSNGRYQILFPDHALRANIKLEQDPSVDRNP